jgi:hypothetical protein
VKAAACLHIPVAIVALCLCAAGHAFAQAAVHSRAELEARMAAGSTALDALTPHGKRAFLDSLRWGERGLGGFGTLPLTRELTAAQIADVLRLLDLEQYSDRLSRELGDGAPLRFAAPAADIETASKAFEKFQREDAAKRQKSADAGTELGAVDLVRHYHAAFDGFMQPKALAARQPADLLLLFDVAAQVMLVGGDPRALLDMRAIFGEFSRRGIDTRRTLDDVMLGALLGGRRFGEARLFADAHPRPGRAAIPREIDTLGTRFAGRSVYRYDAAGNTLERIAVPAAAGIQVVMVVDAACHYSEAALQAIVADAGFSERLRRAGLLVLTPAHSAIPTRFIAQWNADYPQLSLRAPFNAEEWRAVDVTEVPAFFVLENGRVRTKIIGWPGPQQKATLLRALDGPAF